VAEGAGEVPFFDIGVQVAGLVASDGLDEV